MSRCSICECKTMNCVCDPYDKGYAEGRAEERKERKELLRKAYMAGSKNTEFKCFDNGNRAVYYVLDFDKWYEDEHE